MSIHLLEKSARFIIYVALPLSIIALTDQNSLAEQRDFRLINNTSYNIVHTTFPLSIVELTAQNSLADQRNFILINKTSYDIVNLFISRVDQDIWEEDILGKSVLYQGESATISFSGYPDNVCYFDIKVNFDDNTSLIKKKINLCKTRSYTISD